MAPVDQCALISLVSCTVVTLAVIIYLGRKKAPYVVKNQNDRYAVKVHYYREDQLDLMAMEYYVCRDEDGKWFLREYLHPSAFYDTFMEADKARDEYTEYAAWQRQKQEYERREKKFKRVP